MSKYACIPSLLKGFVTLVCSLVVGLIIPLLACHAVGVVVVAAFCYYVQILVRMDRGGAISSITIRCDPALRFTLLQVSYAPPRRKEPVTSLSWVAARCHSSAILQRGMASKSTSVLYCIACVFVCVFVCVLNCVVLYCVALDCIG